MGNDRMSPESEVAPLSIHTYHSNYFCALPIPKLQVRDSVWSSRVARG